MSDHILLYSTHMVTGIVAFFKDRSLTLSHFSKIPRSIDRKRKELTTSVLSEIIFSFFFSFFFDNSGYIQLLGMKHIIFSVEATEEVLSPAL